MLTGVGLCAFAWTDRCGEWPSGEPVVTAAAVGAGPLRVGAAKQAVELSQAVTVGGYGPFRSSATSGDAVFAAATVMEVGGQRAGLVSLELLFVTEPLVAAIRTGFDFPIMVSATHTHTSMGQFDRRPFAQVAALGLFDARVESAVASAARAAIKDALSSLRTATLSTQTFSTAELVTPRSGDAVDTRGLELTFSEGQTVISRWILLAAHPTLAPRRISTFDTDWPGAVARGSDAGVTLVLQTSVGNASVNRQVFADESAVASHLKTRPRLEFEACETHSLSLTTARIPLPRPDGSRVAPFPANRFIENLACIRSEMDAEVTTLRLGCVSLLFLPAEPSWAAVRLLEARSEVTRVVALSNGYLGYLEPDEVVHQGLGESKRQWFSAPLFTRLDAAARLTGAWASSPKEPTVFPRVP
jgi:hypothetical protein